MSTTAIDPDLEVHEALTPAERVANGVAWLDEHKPDWLAEIDLGIFELRSTCRCVLGQTFGGFYEAAANHFNVTLGEYLKPWKTRRVEELGFYTRGEDDDWRALEAAWRSAIRERQTSPYGATS